MKVSYRQTAKDDIIRQFRYYPADKSVPDIAMRFRRAVQTTVAVLTGHPRIAPLYQLRNARFKDLRSWPVTGFDAIRIYYVEEPGRLRIIRILHQKRDVRRILDPERDNLS